MGEADQTMKAPHMKAVNGSLIDNSQRDRAKGPPRVNQPESKMALCRFRR